MHIRILSPSGAIDPQYIDSAATLLRSWGHCVSIAPHAKERYGRFAGTDAQRLGDLNEALADPYIDAILCSRGGYGLVRIMDRIVMPISCHKLIIGFSDITCLHALCATHNIVSLHAIMAKHLSTLPEDSAPIKELRHLLDRGHIHYTLSTSPLSRKGKVTGTLRGGNLSVLYGLQGSRYGLLPPKKEKPKDILFIEDINEAHYHIDRMMQGLRMSGVLERIGGLIIGQFAGCENDPLMKETINETILYAVRDYDYPVLFDFPAGHIDYNMPLLLNHSCEIDIEEQNTLFIQ